MGQPENPLRSRIVGEGEEAPDQLLANPLNWRRHPKEQHQALEAMLRTVGWVQRVIVNRRTQHIVDGHLRVEVALRRNEPKVPVLYVDLTEDEEKVVLAAIDPIGGLAETDQAMLDDLLQGIETGDAELDAFLDSLRSGDPEVLEAGLTDPDETPEVQAQPVTRPGDVWLLGKHRLMCGDSTSVDAVDKLMAGASVDMVYTDPPYGISVVGKNGKVGGDNLAKNGVYAPIAGDESIDVAIEAIQVIKTLNAPLQIIWGGNYYANALENTASWIVWDKRGNMASNNFADCELAWCNAGSPARIYKQVWSGMIKEGESGKRVHPTQKPVKLAQWCIEQYGSKAATVLDLFCGSGSTLIACEATKKAGYMMELSPDYCDVIVRRWQAFTGKTATLEADGRKFAEVEADTRETVDA